MDSIHIRRAQPRDAEAIANFNQAIARETENKELISDVILAGVNALLSNPAYGFYIVAETDAKVVACLMITTEWSDWRNGLFWWVQSVFVSPEYRRRGIYRSMYSFIRELANNEPNVCGFRLYVEQNNTRAQATYTALGMSQSPYYIFEELKADIDYLDERPTRS
ncbi:MAG: GNAT family N-acetyltransferase [Leptolyngbyaceae cyanobacterium MAG.088]|nr:GNAT family N-acetyltransferase [Leptolyngbyaceae cyanobacterium MAG.088]